MKNLKWLILCIVLAMLAGSAGALTWLKKNQKLGVPGIKCIAIPGSVKVHLQLPAHILDFISTDVPEPEVVLGWLPKDTSYVQRHYVAPDGFPVDGTIVMMGMDRTSIHKPDYCLPGQGWRIDKKATVSIPIQGPHPYQLQVAKWTITNLIQNNEGQKQEVCGLYVFWFVAKNEETDSHWQRIWWLTRDLLTTGVLQRWAYVSYFSAGFPPGQEDAVFARIEKLIVASVPEFQLPPDAK